MTSARAAVAARAVAPLVFAALYFAGICTTATGATLVDQRGKTIEFSTPPQRIVVIPLPMAAVVMTLDGSSKRVVGMHPAARQSIIDGFLHNIYPEARSIAADITRGGQLTPNVEAILALRADTVVTWTEPAEAVQVLERAGLRVVTLINNPATREQQESNLRIIGNLIDRNERVERVLAEQERARAAVQRTVEGIPQTAQPRVLYFRSFKQGMYPAGSGSFQDYWIRLAGGRNVAATLSGISTQVTVEQIVAWNPEVILLGTFDNATPADVYVNPAFAGIAAVRNRRVYVLPHGGYRWDPGSHESHLTFLWAARVLHPDRARFDVRAEMRTFYEFLYGIRLTDEATGEILAVQANRESANYTAAFAR